MPGASIAGLTSALTGSQVDVDNDLLAIVDANAGVNGTKRITAKELIANTPAFTPDGTGAVATTLQARGRNVVYITDKMTDAERADAFAGTGSMNLTTAVANAYADLDSENGGVIVFPTQFGKGMYSFNLTVKKNNVWLVLDGWHIPSGGGVPLSGFTPWDTTIPTVQIADDTGRVRGCRVSANFYGLGPNGRGQYGFKMAGGCAGTWLDVAASGHTLNDIGIFGGPNYGTTTTHGRIFAAANTSIALTADYRTVAIASVGGVLRIGELQLEGYISGPTSPQGAAVDTGYALSLVDCGDVHLDGWVNCNKVEHGVYIDDTNAASRLTGDHTIEVAGLTGVALSVKGSSAARQTVTYWTRGQVAGCLRYGVTTPGADVPGGTSTAVVEGALSNSSSQALQTPKIIGSTYFAQHGQAVAGTSPAGYPNVIALNTSAQTATNITNITGGGTNGRCRVTAAGHGLSTSGRVTIAGVTGTTEANGNWPVVVIDVDTIDLKYSFFINAYVSGGTVTRIPQLQVNAGAAANALTLAQGDLWALARGLFDGHVCVGGATDEEVLNVGQKSGSNAITVNAGTTGEGAIKFSDGGANPGMVKYDHNVDEIEIRAATADQLVVTSACTAPATDNAKNLGEAAGTRRWKEIFCTNASINTSDARQKKDVVPLSYGLDFVNKLRPISYRWIVGQNKVESVEIDSTKEVQKWALVKRKVVRAVQGEDGRVEDREIEIEVNEPVFNESGEPVMVQMPCKDYKQLVTPMPGTREHFGLIAQELRAALGTDQAALWIASDPSNPESMQGWRPSEMVPVLIKAVQELSAQLEALKARFP